MWQWTKTASRGLFRRKNKRIIIELYIIHDC